MTTSDVLRVLSGRRFATRVSAGDAPVRNHFVHGTPVLPGTFHLDLMLRVVRHLGVDPSLVELRRCVFFRPVIAVGDLEQQLQVVVGERGDRDGVPVTVRSRPLVGGEVADQEWRTNVQAEIHLAGPWRPREVPRDRLAAAEGPGSMDADDLYALARQQDIEHGPFMKAQGRVAAGDGFSVADVRLDPSAAEEIDHFFVHPVFIDFSVLVPFLQFPAEVLPRIVQPFIPIYVDSVRANRSLTPHCLVHAPTLDNPHLDDSTQTITADIDLCLPDGEVAVQLTGYRLKRVRSTKDIQQYAREEQQLRPGRPTAAGPTPVAAPVVTTPRQPTHVDPAQGLAAVIAGLAAAALGNPGTPVDPDEGFYDLGLTSVDLLTIAEKLEAALNHPLYPTLLFEYPTITELAEHLAAQGCRAPDTEPPSRTHPVPAPAAASHRLAEAAQADPTQGLSALIADLVAAAQGDPSTPVDPDEGFYDLGLTSVDLLTIAGTLETTLNHPLYPTLLFEYPTITELAEHLAAEGCRASGTEPPANPAPQASVMRPEPAPEPVPAPAPRPAGDTPMAIVGVAGRYPGARDLDELWAALRAGRDCVTDVPADRWDAEHWYAEPGTPGRSYLKRGGFVDGVDRFDSLLFNIPPQQAKLMDPQERLFLEVAWAALEDAGHTPDSLSASAGGAVGVFAGSMWADYHLHGLQNVLDGGDDVALTWLGGIPNRVSHAFDFRGPSVLVDTACSASLTALHWACESIRRGECGAALVGGASLSLHPYKYVRSSANGLLSKDGLSRPFGDGASGYVPADGVGALIVRPLTDAEADGDRILAVVRGSAVNHTGRTSGYTITSPEAQSRVVEQALQQAGVPAETITLLEAHGAATALGDQLEVDALTRTFRKYTDRTGFCAIGSVKANLGHTEAAAGIASLTKVLLCLRHRTIVPAPHADPPNPAIPFAGSPFRLPGDVETWTPVTDPTTGRPAPLRAGVSAFGFGGSGAHVVLEEYLPTGAAEDTEPDTATPRVVPLSARTREQLLELAARLAGALRAEPATRLADVAHTLAVGRRHLAERLAVVASGTAELAGALEDVASGRTPPAPAFQGTARRAAGTAPEPGSLAATPGATADIAQAWAEGRIGRLDPVPGARRIALPTYPFARDRHWVTPVTPERTAPGPVPPAPAAAVSLADLEQVMLYEPGWVARPAGRPTVNLDGGPLLVFDTTDIRVRALRARGAAVVLVTPGAGFARESADRYRVDPGSAQDYRDLRRDLEQGGQVPTAILHLWHLDGADPAGPGDRETGLLSVYLLCQAWAIGRRVPLPVVHAYHCPGECPPDASVGGLARGLRLEQPKLPLCTVRFAEPPTDPVRTGELLIAEAAAPGDLEIRHTAAGRQVRGFAPVRPATSGTPLARSGGTYLISGGAGGIARHVARRMAAVARPNIVLFGRSPDGARQQAVVAELGELGARAAYLPCDVTQLSDVERLVAVAEARFGPVTGVVHTAGVVEDGLLINKELSSVRRVLAPKLAGAHNLDLATAGRPLDYLVLFSSTSAVLGSIGTTDYTAANAYLDAFAAWREELTARGERHGRCVSVNWPLWDDGGMRINPAVEQQVLDNSGLVPLLTAHGLAAMEAALAHHGPQLAVFEGDRRKVERLLAPILPERPRVAVTPAPADRTGAPAATAEVPASEEELLAAVESLVSETVVALLPEVADIGDELAGWTFMELGLSSVDVVALGELIDAKLGVGLVPTVFFRHPRVPELAAHLVEEYGEAVRRWHDPATSTPAAPDTPAAPTARTDSAATVLPPTEPPSSTSRDIAIVGMAGRFPGAGGVDELWEALLSGRDLVRDVPADRWDHHRYHDGDGAAGTTECPTGGFIDDVRAFDAAFFGIPRAEAEAMDPQLRLLLEVLYSAAEDAAALPRLRGSDTGVFVGQCFRDYEGEMIVLERAPGPYDATGIATTMAANRPSHYFDLSGPSFAVDTACSSSLHALSLAIESLRRGECSMAFAAGANLILNARHYLALSATGALSPTGRCHAFDERADGYVPAEAVAAVLLKPLDAALADGDPIRAVLKGAAVNHSGHAGTVTAPNPARQTELIERAWRDAGIPVHTMGYLEAHGTGTKLGDPIEVDGLRAALTGRAADAPPCVLSTAKAHLGHAEGAAGLVGVIKAVLSLEHALIPAMPGFQRANPYCGLGDEITVVASTIGWPQVPGVPRRSGVSSFGFGGANAHVVLEQAPPRAGTEPAQGSAPSLAVPFSASSPEELSTLLRRHRAALSVPPSVAADLPAVAATLQHGREALTARAAIVARTIAELSAELDSILTEPVQAGVVRAAPGADGQVVAAATQWVSGVDVAWDAGNGGARAQRLNLPGKPFTAEHFWLREATQDTTPRAAPVPAPAPTSTATVADGATGPAAAALDAARRFLSSSSYDAVSMRRGLERLGAVGSRLAAVAVREHLGSSGPLSGAEVLGGLPAVEPYGRFSARLVDVVSDSRRPVPDLAAERAVIEREFTDLVANHPQLANHAALAKAVIPHIPAVITGRLDALELYFGGEVADLLGRIYTGNAMADHHNDVVAQLADEFARARLAEQPDRPVRILEVGGGTGGTTGPVLTKLAHHGQRVEYTFTDISSSFFRQARQRFAGIGPRLVCKAFNVGQDPAAQGLDTAAFDLLIASNVVHATEDVHVSTGHLRRLLADGGLLLLNEVTSNLDYLFLLFAMIPSWWTCKDDERLPAAPVLAPHRWQAALDRAGFAGSWVLAHGNGVPGEEDQCVIVASAAGSAQGPVEVATRAVEPDSVAVPTALAEPAQPVDTATAVRVHLRDIVAAFLAIPAGSIDDDTSFTELGVDSLGAIQLVRDLEEDFGKLPKVLLYECGTINALTTELISRCPETCERITQAAQPSDTVSRPAPVAVVDPAPVAPDTPGTIPDEDPIAIVGMAVRMPGARTTGELWRNLRDGTELVSEIPADRWDWRPLFGDPHREQGRTNSKWGAFVDGVTEFDADFFGISPREAEMMDPQQRLMLQTAWHAIEDSGHAPASLRGTRTGVFIGATSHDYTAHLARVGRYREPHAVNGNAKTVLANRISFELDLRGPSEAVDTACSSSLTALHRAVRAIQNDECDSCLVGGVHLLLTPDMYVALGQMGALSPDGKCHTFDRSANGFVRGEGVVAVYLKRLSAARADGDTGYALVRGSGVNHGGRAASLPVPNPVAQGALISDVLRRSGTDPRTIGYVEAHGTGTEVGDPIELRGLRKAFAECTGVAAEEPVSAWCTVGSIKSNMGHLEAAAGLAGVAKAVLALRHGTIPPTINYREPNPLLDLDGSPFLIAASTRPWPAPVDEQGRTLPRRAGVSAMGFGGANAHVVLEEYPATAPDQAPPAEAGTHELYVLSARNRERLTASIRALLDHLDQSPPVTAAEVAHTLRTGRNQMAWRLAVVAGDLPDLTAALRGHLAGESVHGVFTGVAGDQAQTEVAAVGGDELSVLAQRWVAGTAGSSELTALSRPGTRRVALPGYPFAADHYWADPADPMDATPQEGAPVPASQDQAHQELISMLDALSRGEVSVDDVDLRLVQNDGVER